MFYNTTGGPSWATDDGSLGNLSAVGDYFFTSTSTSGEQTFTMTLGGLTPGNTVALDLWFSRNGTFAYGSGYFDYSTDGGANWTGFAVLNKDGTACTANGWDTNDTVSAVLPGRRGRQRQRSVHARRRHRPDRQHAVVPDHRFLRPERPYLVRHRAPSVWRSSPSRRRFRCWPSAGWRPCCVAVRCTEAHPTPRRPAPLQRRQGRVPLRERKATDEPLPLALYWPSCS